MTEPGDNVFGLSEVVIDALAFNQVLERLSMIEYQVGLIVDHFGIVEHGPDLPDTVEPPAAD